MKSSKQTIPKSLALIIILLFVIAGVYIIVKFALKNPSKEGCFYFINGESQGWTIDQLYTFDSGPAQKVTMESPDDTLVEIPYEPFEFSNTSDMIQAYTSAIQITDSTVEHCKFYFTSPDLSNDPDWQNIIGFRFDIIRDFTGSSGDWYSHKVFAEIFAENESGEEEIFYEKYPDTDQMNYLEIRNLGVPYYFRSIPAELKFPNGDFTIKQVRIGCVIKGFNYNPNLKFNGGWKVSNVCPLY